MKFIHTMFIVIIFLCNNSMMFTMQRFYGKREQAVKTLSRERVHPDFSCIEKAIKKENLKALASFFDKGCSLECMDENGVTPLIFAIKYNSSTVVDFLIKYGASCSSFGQFKSPLYYAVCTEQPDMIKKLLAAGAKVTESDIIHAKIQITLRDGKSVLWPNQKNHEILALLCDAYSDF